MNEQQQNFEELKRLLKFKRHELPPPGYFNSLSGRIISGIREDAAPGPRTHIRASNSTTPWLAAILRLFEVRPGLVGACAVLLCLMLLVAVVISDHSESPSQGSQQTLAGASPSLFSASAPIAETLMAASDSTGIAINTNPVITLRPALPFVINQNPSSALIQAAGFKPAH